MCPFQRWKETLRHQKVEIEGPDLEGPEGGFKMPKIKMPSFGLKGQKWRVQML